ARDVGDPCARAPGAGAVRTARGPRAPRPERCSPSGSHASLPFLRTEPLRPAFSPRGLRERVNCSTKERSMSTHIPTGFNWAESIQPFADRRERARTVAAFAEYLAENVHGNSDRALEAMASLADRKSV